LLATVPPAPSPAVIINSWVPAEVISADIASELNSFETARSVFASWLILTVLELTEAELVVVIETKLVAEEELFLAEKTDVLSVLESEVNIVLSEDNLALIVE